MSIPTIEWVKGKVKIIDQTLLPQALVFRYCKNVESIWKAIRVLQVRGAPAIGVAGAFGVVLGIQNSKAKNFSEFNRELTGVIRYLATARPTAVNLFWAIKRMENRAEENKNKPVVEIKRILLNEAKKIMDDDKAICRAIGKHGARLIKDRDRVMTHCNAGALATADFGTALGVLYAAKKEGKRISVYADETRPLLQGSRLTAWELMRMGIKTTLICDNMSARVMKEGRVDKIIVGADRIAANGDTANKIGTYGVAVLAKEHSIPFYVAAPISTFDFSLKTGKGIPIEERPPEEVTNPFGKRIAPKGVNVYNPAFDVTPHQLITGFITERGVISPPYNISLRRLKVNFP